MIANDNRYTIAKPCGFPVILKISVKSPTMMIETSAAVCPSRRKERKNKFPSCPPLKFDKSCMTDLA